MLVEIATLPIIVQYAIKNGESIEFVENIATPTINIANRFGLIA